MKTPNFGIQILISLTSISLGIIVMAFGMPSGFLFIAAGCMGFALLPAPVSSTLMPTVYTEEFAPAPQTHRFSDQREIVLREGDRAIGMRQHRTWESTSR